MPLRIMEAVAADPEGLRFPLYAQPKYDGIRCLVCPERGPVTRTGRPLPNPEARAALSDPRLVGLDGELMAPGGLEGAQSAFMGSGPLPDGWRFVAFDDTLHASHGFSVRGARLEGRKDNLPPFAEIAACRLLERPSEVAAALAEALADGHEGLILRSPTWGYRQGKASPARAELVKIKPVDDEEAEILDVAARSDDQSALGSVTVRFRGRPSGASVAMSRDHARALWSRRHALPGQLATIRHMGLTAHGLPRNPVMIALRRDLAA